MLNKVMLIANLGNDVELRYTQSGIAVASFNVATTERYKDKDGQMQETTEWHRIVAWSKLADTCAEHLHKGSKVYIEGKLQTRPWEKDNIKQYTTEIVAKEVKFLSPRSQNDQQGQQEYEPPQGNGRDDSQEVPF